MCIDGDIRLQGGKEHVYGRVEICNSGMWETVCDDSWDNDDAKVVCNQLGIHYTSVCLINMISLLLLIHINYIECVNL